jgi:ABC-type polysaccharide/polyol phosphate transport system ATPase subunit/ABC-type polysaccharide/polyol phosphate export permease
LWLSTGTEATQELARPAAPASCAVSVSGLRKSFRLPHERHDTIKERLAHPFRHVKHETLTALDDVSFDVRRGEFFGIVGRNGSGKSTLLKCVSGIYRPDGGALDVDGRLAPFIELGVGFNPDLSAADNVILGAILLGLTPRQARERFDDIVRFAEMERFIDLKLKNLSSGMQVRLAFAVTIQVDADVLVFDEVLAVGDSGFQQKCFERFERLKSEGRTVLVVTHDMAMVERFCDRAMVLDAGRLVDIGAPEEIASSYDRLNDVERRRPPSDADSALVKPVNGSRPAYVAPRAVRPSLGGLRSRLRRLVTLTRAMSVAEFKLHYLDSVLSYVWVMAGPLAFFAILYLVFTNVGSFNHGVPHYPLYLLTSLMMWTFFATATTGAISSLVRHEPLLRKLPLPHSVIPLSVVVTALFDLAMNSIAVVVFVLVAGISPRLSWLEMPGLLGLLALFVTGVSLILSALYVRFRDVEQIWILLRQSLFYCSPIFYVAATLPDRIEKVALVNPLAAIFTQARHALIDPSAPTAADVIGGHGRLLVPLGVVLVTFAVGVWVFHRESPRAAENL